MNTCSPSYAPTLLYHHLVHFRLLSARYILYYTIGLISLGIIPSLFFPDLSLSSASRLLPSPHYSNTLTRLLGSLSPRPGPFIAQASRSSPPTARHPAHQALNLSSSSPPAPPSPHPSQSYGHHALRRPPPPSPSRPVTHAYLVRTDARRLVWRNEPVDRTASRKGPYDIGHHAPLPPPPPPSPSPPVPPSRDSRLPACAQRFILAAPVQWLVLKDPRPPTTDSPNPSRSRSTPSQASLTLLSMRTDRQTSDTATCSSTHGQKGLAWTNSSKLRGRHALQPSSSTLLPVGSVYALHPTPALPHVRRLPRGLELQNGSPSLDSGLSLEIQQVQGRGVKKVITV
ncbi:hypothetical protein NMY22_g11246 [Coprinellus aureogranulatus]|nr:hypothetical protein NMY22_g11246 [Coprinellus aureogranulatus]